MILGSAVIGCGREAWFWLALPFQLLRRHRGLVLAGIGVAVVTGALGYGHAVRVGLVGLVARTWHAACRLIVRSRRAGRKYGL